MQQKSSTKYGIWIAVGCGVLLIGLCFAAGGGYLLWTQVPGVREFFTGKQEPQSANKQAEPQEQGDRPFNTNEPRPVREPQQQQRNFVAPSNFRVIPAQSGTGEVLIAKITGSKSAKALLSGTLQNLTSYYDRRPVIISGFADREDQAAQALVACVKNEESYRALVQVQTSQSNAQIAWLTDRTTSFDRSFTELSQIAGQNFPRKERKNVQWYQAQLADGSGSVRLPSGWVIGSAKQGMVSIGGPSGQSVDLGIWYQVYTPEAASSLYTRPTLVAPYTDPLTAAQNIVPQLSAWQQQQFGSPPVRLERIVEHTPVENPNGTAAYIHHLSMVGEKPVEGLAMIAVSPVGDGIWIYYFSGCLAPRASFRQDFPLMWEIWSSWKVADHVYRQRMNQALKSMREAHLIYQQAQSNAIEVSSDANAKWSEYIRDTRQVRDDRDGTIEETSAQGVEKLLETLNQSEGYERWTIIPMEDLNRH